MLNKTLDFSSLRDPETPSDVQPAKPEDAGYAELSDSLAAIPADSQDEEEALEQYMNSMLERLTGNKTAKPTAEKTAAPVEKPVVKAPVVAKPPAREPTRPSESKEDLNGMRALANQNVENALGVHSSRQLVRQTTSALFTAMGASVASSLMIVLTQNQGSSPSWVFPAALTALGAALLVSVRYFRLARRIAKLQRQLEVVAE